MPKRLVSKVVLLCCFCFLLSSRMNVKANSSSVQVSVDKSAATVTVTVTDASLSGKEVSIICYDPSWNGAQTDWSVKSGHVAYLGQRKLGTPATFTFRLNSKVAEGNYTLVLGADGKKVEQKFSFDAPKKDTGVGPVHVDPPIIEDKKAASLKAPSIKVKVKGKKVTVSWKKIKGAKGYQVYTAKKKKGKYKRIATLKKATKVKYTFSLKKKKKCYIKVRAYKKVSGKMVYSKYSKIKKASKAKKASKK